MDGAVAPSTKGSDGQELLNSVQTATQSQQQFKTMDDSKANLRAAGTASNSSQEIGLKKNLQASHSERNE